jgi:RHS repeat-associated protein
VNSVTTSFAYDGDNLRASQTANSVTTDYVWDRVGTLPVVVDDGTNAYLQADGLLAQIDGNDDALYSLADALGSVRALTDESGTVVGTADYSPFGDVTSTSGTTSVFGFTGEQQDTTTGLTYLRARYLSPELGRFVSMDTVQPNAPGTQGYNRCAYAANNPATWTDPSGHSAADVICGIIMGRTIQTVISIFLIAHGFLVGVHRQGAYVVGIAAGAVAAGAGAELAIGDTDAVRAGEAIGGGLLIANGLALSFLVTGVPHVSMITFFAILLASVLLLLAGAMLRALAETLEFTIRMARTYSPGALACRNWTGTPWAPHEGPPSIGGSQSPEGGDIGAVAGASNNLPLLPSP